MTQTTVEAVAAAKARAQKRCRACGQQRMLDKDGYRFEGLQRLTTVTAKHTCHGDLGAVCNVALAVLETQPHLHEYEYVNSPCDPSAVMEVSSGCPRCCCEAEIERQFGLPERTEKQ